MWRCKPSDPQIEDLDPLEKLYMFEHWVQDRRERAEGQKHLGYLIGSFTNPEAVKRLLDSEANTYASDDEEFDALSHRIHEANLEKDRQLDQVPKRHRKKKKILNK